MSTAEGGVMQSDALPPPGRQGAHVRWKHGYRTGPDEPNGFNECLDPGVPNGPSDRTGPNEPNGPGERNGPSDRTGPNKPNGPGERNGPGDRNASADAGVEANTDHSAILTLAAWMMGGIVLQSPPGFLVCTHPRATRVVMLDFFEEYLEGKVIAVVPPSVRMPQHIAEKTLLLQLLERREEETVSDPLSRELVKGEKRTRYDSDTRRLTFVLPDQAAAASWHAKFISFRGTRLQLLCPATMEREDIAASSTSGTTSIRNILQYQVRILVHGVAASTVQAILSSSESCLVTSVVWVCLNGAEADQVGDAHHDSRHDTVHPSSPAFPTGPLFLMLLAVSFKRAARKGEFLFDHHRAFIDTHHVAKKVSGLMFQHLDVSGRMQHVAGLAETLQATTTKLKDDACKAPLLTKISQSSPRDSPREETSPSPPRGQPAASGGAARAAGPSTDGWFNPGANKKKRESRSTTAPTSPPAVPTAQSLRRSQLNQVGRTGKPPIPGPTPLGRPNARISIKGAKKSSPPTKAKMPPNRRPEALAQPPAASALSKAAKQRATAINELDQLLEGESKAAAADSPSERGSVAPTKNVSPKELALEEARAQVEEAKRKVDVLTSTAAEKKRAAEFKKTCYFEAHVQALEVAIAHEATGEGKPTSLEDAEGHLPSLEHEYRTAGAVANRAKEEAMNATSRLKTLTRRLAKITPKEKSESEVAVTRIATQPSEMPAATAEKIRERSRSTIQRLLTSYIRRKRVISGVTSESPAGAAPTAAVPHDPAPSDMPPTCP